MAKLALTVLSTSNYKQTIKSMLKPGFLLFKIIALIKEKKELFKQL